MVSITEEPKLSKRAMKRAEKASKAGVGSGQPSSPDVTQEDAPVKSVDARQELIHKKLRALTKKKQRLEKIEEQSKSPDADKLNTDQKSILANKEAFLVHVRDFEELSKQFEALSNSERQESQRKAAEQSKTQKAQKEQSYAEGYQAGLNVVHALTQFLRHAAVVRNDPYSDQALNDAFEKLLVTLYQAPSNSAQIAELIMKGSDTECIEGSEVTYSTVQKATRQFQQDLERPHDPVADSLEQANQQEEQHRPTQSSSGIRFLNESEIDAPGVQEQADIEAPMTNGAIPGTKAGIASSDGGANAAAVSGWDVSASQAEMDQLKPEWASETPVQGLQEPSHSHNSAEIDPEGFVQKRSRGGARGSHNGGYRGRGRGSRGRGESRGENRGRGKDGHSSRPRSEQHKSVAAPTST